MTGMASISGISATPYFNGISSAVQGQVVAQDAVKKPIKAMAEPGISPIRPTLAPGLEKSEKTRPKSDKTQDDTRSQTSSSGFDDGLTEEEKARVRELQARDREVKAHERAHQAAGGRYAGAASYTYEKGPDGNRYAVGGEVPIDVSPVSGDPEATAQKMRVVIRAALAPAEPSAQDQRVAQKAQSTLLEAQAEIAQQRTAESQISFDNPNDINTAKSEQSPIGNTENSARAVSAYQKTQDYSVQNAFTGQIDPSTETNIII